MTRPLADGGQVWAAGGVVVRWDRGRPQVALVHRPRRDDWTFPKGHLEAGESPEDAALREVEEETALRCRPLRPIGRSSYVDHRGRPKVVDYWLIHNGFGIDIGDIIADSAMMAYITQTQTIADRRATCRRSLTMRLTWYDDPRVVRELGRAPSVSGA